MKHILKHISLFLISALLLAVPAETMAQKKGATTKKTTTTPASSKKKTTPASSSKKNNTTTTNKPAATPAKPQKKTGLSRAEYEKQQRDLQKRIKATEKMISDNDQSVRAQNRDIKLREQEIGQRRALLVAMHKEIEAIQLEEDSLKHLIAELQKNFESKKTKYGMAMRHMYKNRGGYEELTFILSASSMMEGIRRMRYLRQYSEWRKNEALELEQQRIATEEAKEKLTKTRQDRQKVLSNIDAEREALTRKQEEQQAALASLQKRGKELQAELQRDQKQQAEIQKKIQQMINEERRKAEDEARRKAAEEAKRKTSDQQGGTTPTSVGNKLTSDKPTELTNSPSNVTALTGNFRANKGKLPYPVDSNFAFLRHYKEKNDGNVSITLSTSVGANACSVFEGTVLRCSRSSEDYTVIVSHGDYMSVYSNLSSVSVKEGQTVKMRQVIGKIKSDLDGRRGELMFWIYGKSDAENPEVWLKR